jgi:hypothetical protein
VSGRATQCRTRRGPRRGCPLGATQSRRGLPPETVPQTEGVRLGGSGGRPAGKRDRRSPRAAHPPLQRGLGGPVEAAERGNRRRAAKPQVREVERSGIRAVSSRLGLRQREGGTHRRT